MRRDVRILLVGDGARVPALSNPADHPHRRRRKEHHHHVSHQGGLRRTCTSSVPALPSSAHPFQVQHVVPEVTIPPEVTPENVTTYIVDSGGAYYPPCPISLLHLPQSRPTGQTTPRVGNTESTRHMCRVRHRQPKLLRPHTYVLASSFPPTRRQCLSLAPLTMLPSSRPRCLSYSSETRSTCAVVR